MLKTKLISTIDLHTIPWFAGTTIKTKSKLDKDPHEITWVQWLGLSLTWSQRPQFKIMSKIQNNNG